jgi:hypothetical protein
MRHDEPDHSDQHRDEIIKRIADLRTRWLSSVEAQLAARGEVADHEPDVQHKVAK